MQVVRAAHSVSCFANLLDCGQEESNQHGDNGNDHEQLDQGETLPASYGKIPLKKRNGLLVRHKGAQLGLLRDGCASWIDE
jgi:hypothetical protein